MAGWIDFWNSDHPIYVNDRHRDVHYRAIAEDIRGYVTPGAAVLDYGCGEALHADRIARAARRLILCDAAPKVRDNLQARFAAVANIEVRAPDEVVSLPQGSLDLIVMHSVAQYLGPNETEAVFSLFRRLLKPGGLFILGDVIPPKVSPVADAAALLRFAAKNGFLTAGLVGLVRTVFSDYPRLRAQLGLSLYEETEMKAKLTEAGFAVERAAKNIGHSQQRMTFLARPR